MNNMAIFWVSMLDFGHGYYMDGNKSLMCFSLGNARDQPPDTEFPPG